MDSLHVSENGLVNKPQNFNSGLDPESNLCLFFLLFSTEDLFETLPSLFAMRPHTNPLDTHANGEL